MLNAATPIVSFVLNLILKCLSAPEPLPAYWENKFPIAPILAFLNHAEKVKVFLFPVLDGVLIKLVLAIS